LDASQQIDTPYGMRIRSNNLQPLGMLPANHSTNKGNKGQPDALQSRGSSNRLTHTNNNTTTITSTSNHTSAAISHHFYQKTPEKITLQLPPNQDNTYRNTAIKPLTTRITNSANNTHHQHPHPHTPNDAIRPTKHCTTISASAAPCDSTIATALFTPHESPFRQQNPYNSDSLKL